jgi:hypothetical protein
MFRWLEQLEIKHAEFERVVKYFTSMSKVWSTVAAKRTSSGSMAFARSQVSIYAGMASEADRRYESTGIERLRKRIPGRLLSDAVEEFRRIVLKGLV